MKNCPQPSLSIQNSLAGKTILILGVSGFIGKVLFAMLLEFVPNIQKIYLLVRSKDGKNAQARFSELYSQSPVFTHICQKYNTSQGNIPYFEIVDGDASLINLGLSNAHYERFLNEIDLIINFAGDVRFFAPLDMMLKTNVQSLLEIANFILISKKCKLLHVSTCYVSGARDNFVLENINQDISPNGHSFSAIEEFNTTYQKSLVLYKNGGTTKDLISLGAEKSRELGWTNSYTYSKALAEILLKQKLPCENFCIFRPSIVGSAEKYPYPGWNEGVNGSAPLARIVCTHGFLVAKPHHILDIIPVDYVAKGLTIAAAALLTNTHAEIYQSATSSIHPLLIEEACEFCIEYSHKKQSKVLFLSPNQSFTHFKNQFCGSHFNSKQILNRFKAIDNIMKMYQPFIYDYNNTFQSENLFAHDIVENEFHCHPKNINWRKYWLNIHLPAIFQKI